MPDLTLRIKTAADLAALEKTRAELLANKEAYIAAGNSLDEHNRKLKQLEAAINSAEASRIRWREEMSKNVPVVTDSTATSKTYGKASTPEQEEIMSRELPDNSDVPKLDPDVIARLQSGDWMTAPFLSDQIENPLAKKETGSKVNLGMDNKTLEMAFYEAIDKAQQELEREPFAELVKRATLSFEEQLGIGPGSNKGPTFSELVEQAKSQLSEASFDELVAKAKSKLDEPVKQQNFSELVERAKSQLSESSFSELVAKAKSKLDEPGKQATFAELVEQARGSLSAPSFSERVKSATKQLDTGEETGWLDRFKHKVEEAHKVSNEAGGGLRGGLLGAFELLGGKAGVAAAAIGGLTMALGAAFQILKEIGHALLAPIEKFAHLEMAVTKLDAALASSGHLNDSYREKLQELAEEMAATTAIANDKWLAVLTRLTQYGAAPENIEKYSDAVKNLAGLMGGDIEQAAMLFSRAMEGNTYGLSRYGIFVERGASVTEKLDQIMQQAAQKGGQALEANAKTIHGQFQLLANSTNSVIEKFGQLLAESKFLQTGMFLFRSVLDSVAEYLPHTTRAVEGLKNVLGEGGLRRAAIDAKVALGDLDAAMDNGPKTAKQLYSELIEVMDKRLAKLTAEENAINMVADATTKLQIAELEAEKARKLRAGDTVGAAKIDDQIADVKNLAEEKKADTRLGFLLRQKEAINERDKESNRIVEERAAKQAAADAAIRNIGGEEKYNEFQKQAAELGVPTPSGGWTINQLKVVEQRIDDKIKEIKDKSSINPLNDPQKFIEAITSGDIFGAAGALNRPDRFAGAGALALQGPAGIGALALNLAGTIIKGKKEGREIENASPLEELERLKQFTSKSAKDFQDYKANTEAIKALNIQLSEFKEKIGNLRDENTAKIAAAERESLAAVVKSQTERDSGEDKVRRAAIEAENKRLTTEAEKMELAARNVLSDSKRSEADRRRDADPKLAEALANRIQVELNNAKLGTKQERDDAVLKAAKLFLEAREGGERGGESYRQALAAAFANNQQGKNVKLPDGSFQQLLQSGRDVDLVKAINAIFDELNRVTREPVPTPETQAKKPLLRLPLLPPSGRDGRPEGTRIPSKPSGPGGEAAPLESVSPDEWFRLQNQFIEPPKTEPLRTAAVDAAEKIRAAYDDVLDVATTGFAVVSDRFSRTDERLAALEASIESLKA